MKVYIAGPMTGLPSHNWPAFDAAAAFLRSQGHEVISPAEMDRALGLAEDGPVPDGFLRKCFPADIAAIATCDAIAVLPGWHNSRGAKIELEFAKMIGLEVLCATKGTPAPP